VAADVRAPGRSEPGLAQSPERVSKQNCRASTLNKVMVFSYRTLPPFAFMAIKESEVNLYRVWDRCSQEFYWTVERSPARAVELVSSLFSIDSAELDASLESDAQYNITKGIILDGSGTVVAFVWG
jgi:hypothetical protein